MAAVKVLAHRGIRSLWPENSLIALTKAAELGADGIECDLRSTRDGHIILMHDPTVDRTSAGQGVAGELTLAEIRRLDLRGPEGSVERSTGVPTLDQVLAALVPTGIHLRLEVKEPGFEPALVARIRALGLMSRTVISSFLPSVIMAVKDADPSMQTALIAAKLADSEYEHVRPYINGVDLAGGPALTAGAIDRVRGDGLVLTIWAVNSKARFDEVIGFEPDYVMTDYPQRILPLLGRDVPDWATCKE